MKRRPPAPPPKAAPEPRTYVYPRQHRWQMSNPDKVKAHQAVRKAVRIGALVKQACTDCGNPRAEAHHPDYRAQLFVIWVCRACHKARHRRSRSK